MKSRVFPLTFAFALGAGVAHARDPEHLPWDIRMPVRVGGGYTAMFGDAAVLFSIGGAFIGRPLFGDVRPQFEIGMGGLRSSDLPLVLPDAMGKPTPFGFGKSFAQVETGLGVFIGGSDGFAVSVLVIPGADLGSIPGKTKDESIGTVGFGLASRVEIIPWFLAMRRGEDEEGEDARNPGYGRWLLASLSIWIEGRMDWVEGPVARSDGPALGGGFGFDIARIALLPFFPRESE